MTEAILTYTADVEQFMVDHGFDRDEAHDLLAHWRDDPNDIIFHGDPAYWYYHFVTVKHPLKALEYHFHSHCRNNEEDVRESNAVGCFTCNRIYRSVHITDFIDTGPVNASTKTAVCPECHQSTIVGDYIFCIAAAKKKDREWFTERIREAYEFWTVHHMYRLA